VSALTELHVDLGNSRGKWRLLHANHIVSQGTVEPESGRGLPNLQLFDIKVIYPIQVTLASVADAAIEAHLRTSLREQFDCVIETLYTPLHAMGMINAYADHSRLGIDRWLAMLAAWHPCQADVVMVDAGSALTLDVVAANGQHQGGVIIPGANLSERALLEKTGKVRFEENVEHELLLGHSTAECVRYGIAHSQLGALESIAKRFDLGNYQWFFAGGAGDWLMQRMDVEGVLAPDLVLDGIGLMQRAVDMPVAG
jgi:type III pantothenate kinase